MYQFKHEVIKKMFKSDRLIILLLESKTLCKI